MISPGVLDRIPCASAMIDICGMRPEVGDIVCAVIDALDGQPAANKQALKTWKTVSRQRYPQQRALFAILCLGRRWGKTTLAAILIVFEAVCRGWLHERYALRGTRINYVVLAPELVHSRESVRAILAVLESLRPLGVRWSVRDLSGNPEIVLELPGRRCEHAIVVLTASSTSVRGFAIAALVMDESGKFPSDARLISTDKDIFRSIRPAMLQFPEARLIVLGTPGPPQGLFHEWVEKVTPKGAVLLRAPTWTNGRYSIDRCRKMADEDSHGFEQEYAVSRFGYDGSESFIDTSRIVMGSPHCGKGPRPGAAYCVSVDLGGLVDAHALLVASSFEVEISAGHAPVRHVVVEHCEALAPSKANPIPIEAVAARANALSLAYGNACCVFDPYSAPTLELFLRRLGFREHKEPEHSKGLSVPPPRTYARRSMAPQHQTPRALLVKSLAESSRLHLADNHQELKRQLARLSAVQQSSGALKVEGRHYADDLADVLFLASEVAIRLPPSGGPGGIIQRTNDGVFHEPSAGGLQIVNPRWTRTDERGRRTDCEMPEWAPEFGAHAEELALRGIWTPATIRWFERNKSA
jgi:hypothetical protein